MKRNKKVGNLSPKVKESRSTENLPTEDLDHWSKTDKYDSDAFLDSSYRKHLSRHANK